MMAWYNTRHDWYHNDDTHDKSADFVIGASLSEPHTGQTASPAIYDL